MASTFLARRPVCIQLLRLSSHLSHPEQTRPSAIQYGINKGTKLFRHRRSFLASALQSSRGLSVVRGKVEGMDGKGETVTPLANTSETKIEEQVLEGSRSIEQEENDNTGNRKRTLDKKQEEEAGWQGKSFRLTESCSLVLHSGDVTKWYKDGKTDAIVNAANERMLGGGGVDFAIHKAAGRGLFEACQKVPEVSKGVRCPVGRAIITPGFRLPVAHVIHTVGPVYFNERNPASLLSEAYKNSVTLAVENNLKYIAFPAISCGVYGYPFDEAAKVSIQVLRESADQLLEVHFVLFEADVYAAWLAEAEDKLERRPV